MEKTPKFPKARHLEPTMMYFAYVHDMGDHYVGKTYAGDEVILPKQTDEGGA